MKRIHFSAHQLILQLVCCLGMISNAFTQCASGMIGVTGSGCGCLSGCNLSSLGGPNCSPSVSGDCDGGQRTMSVNIVVPSGCTFSVTATMRQRSGGCTASGGDSGDKMKVDVSGGSKPFQSGSSNATLDDSYTLVGPGTIVVSGTANRADEIITYSTISGGAFCTNCQSVLPTELLSFDAQPENGAVACSWTTETELNNDYFTVERSTDGIHFEAIEYVKGAGNSSGTLQYKLYDYDPYTEIISYYRLLQTDFNGNTRTFEVRTVKPSRISQLVIYPNPSTGNVQINGDFEALSSTRLFDVSGREISLTAAFSKEDNTIHLSGLPVGVYSLMYFDNEKIVSERLVVTP